MNREQLTDWCTVQVAVRTPMPGGGVREDWQALSPKLDGIPCRVALMGVPVAGGPSERARAEYSVAFDDLQQGLELVNVQHRLLVSGGNRNASFSMALYIVTPPMRQSQDVFPVARCTNIPQPGA